MNIKTGNLFAIIMAVVSLLLAQRSLADPFIGEIRIFSGNYAPSGWALCDGQTLSIAANQALFSIIGTSYGGDGETTFALPDARGRVLLHAGAAPGLSNYTIGQNGGQEMVSLATEQMPEHSHELKATEDVANRETPNGHSFAAKTRTKLYSDSDATVTMASASIESTGGGQAHENRPPYLTVNCIIALTGLFPSRN